uniref:Uncharacterized protein n=1 Tax=Setaria italica TaxID=4555 RepID=K4AHZ4_SETIT
MHYTLQHFSEYMIIKFSCKSGISLTQKINFLALKGYGPSSQCSTKSTAPRLT